MQSSVRTRLRSPSLRSARLLTAGPGARVSRRAALVDGASKFLCREHGSQFSSSYMLLCSENKEGACRVQTLQKAENGNCVQGSRTTVHLPQHGVVGWRGSSGLVSWCYSSLALKERNPAWV